MLVLGGYDKRVFNVMSWQACQKECATDPECCHWTLYGSMHPSKCTITKYLNNLKSLKTAVKKKIYFFYPLYFHSFNYDIFRKFCSMFSSILNLFVGTSSVDIKCTYVHIQFLGAP